MHPSLEPTACFSPDATTARQRFLAAAQRLALQLEAVPFSAPGPSGQALCLDAAWLGEGGAQRVVVVSSGLHGVEGFLGSAVQLAWLQRQAGPGALEFPGDTALLMLHALNPHGFASLRRVNENNVDLNRNFLDDRDSIEADPGYRESLAVYRRLDPLLNPGSAPPPVPDGFPMRALLRIGAEGLRARGRLGAEAPSLMNVPGILRLGLDTLRDTLPVGQYERPRGLFYGGAQPEETTRVLRERLPRWLAGAREVLHLDFHTGLGPRGACRLHIVDPAGSEQDQRLCRRFGAELVEPCGGRSEQGRGSYLARGQMTADLRARLSGLRYDGLTAEFGTHASLRVLAALRAENRAHFHARPGSPAWKRAKAELLEVFCPGDPRWREATVRTGLALIDRALEDETARNRLRLE